MSTILTILCILAVIAMALTGIFITVSEFTKGGKGRFSAWWHKVDLYAILGSYSSMMVFAISYVVVRIWGMI